MLQELRAVPHGSKIGRFQSKKLTGEYVKTSNLGRNRIEYCLHSIYPRGPITETEAGNGTPSYLHTLRFGCDEGHHNHQLRILLDA